MTATCDSYIQGVRLRVTRLDECGNPVEGPASTIVSKGFVNVEPEHQTTNSTELAGVNAAGERIYYLETPPTLNNITVNIEMLEVDPELFEMFTGAPLVLDDAVSPVAHGFVTDSAYYALGNVALEVWTNLARGGCPVGTGRRWGYYLLPWLVQGRVSPPTIENGSVNFSITEAKTRDGNGWGTGPYNVQLDKDGNPSGLFTPLSVTAHELVYKVNVAPPEPTCGAVALVLPS